MRALLDTSILIALHSSTESSPDLGDVDEGFLSSLSYSELTLGLHTAPDVSSFRERAARIEAVRRTLGEGLPYDDLCDQFYDEALLRVGQRAGQPRARRFDRMIAATAMAHDLALITRNTADFSIFDGMLDVVER